MKTNIFPVFPPRSTAPTHPFQPYSMRSQFGIPAFEAWWLCPVVGPRCAVQQSSTIPAALHIHLPLFALLKMIVTGKAKRFKVIICNLFQPLSGLTGSEPLHYKIRNSVLGCRFTKNTTAYFKCCCLCSPRGVGSVVNNQDRVGHQGLETDMLHL